MFLKENRESVITVRKNRIFTKPQDMETYMAFEVHYQRYLKQARFELTS